MAQTFPERGNHADILRLADGTAVWFDPACTACAAGHRPSERPTIAEVAVWDAATSALPRVRQPARLLHR